MTDKEKYTHDFEKPIVYIDMDNVLVDFQSGIDKLKSLCFPLRRGQTLRHGTIKCCGYKNILVTKKTVCYLSDLFFRIIKTLIKARI